MSTEHLQERSLFFQCLRDIVAEIKEMHPNFRSCFREHNRIVAVCLFPESKFCIENAEAVIRLESRCSWHELYLQVHILRCAPGLIAGYRFKQPYAPGEDASYLLKESDHVSRNVGLPRNYPTKTLSNWKKLIMTKAEQYFNIQVRRLDSNMRLGTDISLKTAMMSRQQATSAVHATMVARCWSSSLQRCMQMYMFTKNLHLMVLWYPIAWGFTPAACCTRLTSPILIGLCMTR